MALNPFNNNLRRIRLREKAFDRRFAGFRGQDTHLDGDFDVARTEVFKNPGKGDIPRGFDEVRVDLENRHMGRGHRPRRARIEQHGIIDRPLPASERQHLLPARREPDIRCPDGTGAGRQQNDEHDSKEGRQFHQQ